MDPSPYAARTGLRARLLLRSVGLLAPFAGLQLAPAPLVAQDRVARACETLPGLGAPPSPIPPSTTPPELDFSDTFGAMHAFDARVSIGVGHLRVTTEHYHWLREVSIPLFAEPDAVVPVAWIHGGWLLGSPPPAPRRRLGYRGMVETSYEIATPIVLETRSNGWLRLRYDLPPEALQPDSAEARPENWLPTEDGTAWTHDCYLGLGEAKLAVQLWRDLFFGPDAPPLSFLDAAPHALREGPTTQAAVVAWVEADDEVEAIEIQNEWMRVRVSKPGKFLTLCTSMEEWDGEMVEGWVKWWDPEDGPWLWYPTRGC